MGRQILLTQRSPVDSEVVHCAILFLKLLLRGAPFTPRRHNAQESSGRRSLSIKSLGPPDSEAFIYFFVGLIIARNGFSVRPIEGLREASFVMMLRQSAGPNQRAESRAGMDVAPAHPLL